MSEARNDAAIMAGKVVALPGAGAKTKSGGSGGGGGIGGGGGGGKKGPNKPIWVPNPPKAKHTIFSKSSVIIHESLSCIQAGAALNATHVPAYNTFTRVHVPSIVGTNLTSYPSENNTILFECGPKTAQIEVTITMIAHNVGRAIAIKEK
jgi:hypothetical protein